MNYTLKDLLDVPKVQALLDTLDEIHGLPSAIIDVEGNILTATAWQEICTKFHRVNPEAEKKCKESDSFLAKELDKHSPHVVYKCPFGLVDTATPIIVEGRHLGNVFTGQLFTEPPDENRFIRQAREYGFKEKDYLNALRKVPMIPEKHLRKNLAFLGRFTEMLAAQGLVHLRQLESAKVLKESERRYRHMFEANPHPMWVFDTETMSFLSVNDAAITHYGYSREEFLSMTIMDIRPAQDLPHLRDALERAEKSPGIDKSQARHRKRDGTLIDVEITSHAIEFDGRRARLITANNITERKKANEALKKSEALYHDLVETSQDLIWQCDIEGKYVYLNPSWETVFGYTVEEMLGKKFTDFQSPVAAGNDIQEFARLIRGNSVHGFETTHTGKDGSSIHLVFSAKAVFDAQGKIIGTRGTAYDITERKRTEEKLITIMKAVESTSDAVGISDAQGHHFFQNKALSDLFGYASAEELEAAGGGRIVVKDPAVARKMFNDIMSGGSWAGELEMVKKSGSVFPAYERADAIKDSEGKIIGLIGIITDITEHKKADDELHLFKDLVQHSADAIGMSTPEGKHYFQNEAFDRMFGKIGDYPPETVYVDKAVGKQVFNTILGGGSWQGEVKMFKSDGMILDILLRAYAIKNQNDRIIGLVGLHTDITERKKTEESLLKLSQAVEQSPISIVITDVKGNIEFVNPWFTQVTGYEAAEVVGKNPRILKSGETPLELHKELWETITGGRVWEGEFHNKKKNGELFWEHAAISPIRDRDGTITHYLGIKEDITEKKKLEEQLRQAQKMEAIGQLAGGVAHDFNNILSAITGYASLLEMSIPSDETLRDYIAEISVASERGALLTQSLLAFSRKQEATLTVVDLNDQVRSSHKILSRLVGEDVDLVLDLDREDMVVEADTGQLQQALMNLTSNARDAMPNGGTLRIATRNITIDSDHRERYSLERPRRYALLTVTDTGIGMEQDIREHVFEPFYTTKGVGKGTGLGLAIVYGMVQKHKGSITVDSEPGKGTVFSIYLPLTERSVRGRGMDANLTPAAAGNKTILVVEDEEQVRRVIRLTLEAYGYRVIEACDGEDAVRVFRDNKDEVMLVLCDLIMPKKNGRVACEEIKGIRPDIKTIFMSGYTKDIFDQKGISETDITLLVKPINPKELVKKISEELEGTQRLA